MLETQKTLARRQRIYATLFFIIVIAASIYITKESERQSNERLNNSLAHNR